MQKIYQCKHRLKLFCLHRPHITRITLQLLFHQTCTFLLTPNQSQIMSNCLVHVLIWEKLHIFESYSIQNKQYSLFFCREHAVHLKKRQQQSNESTLSHEFVFLFLHCTVQRVGTIHRFEFAILSQ